MLLLLLTLATNQYPCQQAKVFVPLPDPYWAYTIGQQKYNEEQLAELKSYAKTAERRAHDAEIFELKKLLMEQQMRLAILNNEPIQFSQSNLEQEQADPEELEVREVLKMHCIGCHNVSKKSGGLDLTKSKFTLGERLLMADYVESKEMPPKSPLPAPAANAIIKWGRKDKEALRRAYRSIGD